MRAVSWLRCVVTSESPKGTKFRGLAAGVAEPPWCLTAQKERILGEIITRREGLPWHPLHGTYLHWSQPNDTQHRVARTPGLLTSTAHVLLLCTKAASQFSHFRLDEIVPMCFSFSVIFLYSIATAVGYVGHG